MKILIILLFTFSVISCNLSYLTRKPEYDLETPQLIKRHGYPVESHQVTTEDGYLLTLHRIPASPKTDRSCSKRPVVFITHTMLCSSSCWIVLGPDKSLPYLLADQGYDVWLGNSRGNKYSRRHNCLNPSQPRFWDFSWHEMGIYDLPASIDYILNLTDQKDLYYVGHSMGSTMFYVLASMRPEINTKIRHMVSIAPVVYTDHVVHSLFRLAALSEIGADADRKYCQEFLPSSKIRNRFLQNQCRDGSISQELCSFFIYFYAGLDFPQFNRTLLPAIFTHFPVGTSFKTWVHYGQGMTSGMFRQYDHGRRLNKKLYGTPEPWNYNLTSVTTPVSIIYSENDLIATAEDVENLCKALPKVVSKIVVPVPLFSHLDFLWGIDVKTVAYDDVIRVLKKF